MSTDTPRSPRRAWLAALLVGVVTSLYFRRVLARLAGSVAHAGDRGADR
jgi:hypothetical protein